MGVRSIVKLDLPKLTIRPPVPPRVYNKVYQYISSTISAPSTPRRGAAKHREDISATQLSTPSKLLKSRPNDILKTAKPSTPLTNSRTIEHGEPPEWVMPAIRALCAALKRPDASPHVFAGVSSVLKAKQDEMDTPSRKRKRKSDDNASPVGREKTSKEDITPLIAVIAFYTISELDEAPEANEYVRQRKLAINTLAKFDPRGRHDENEITAQIENMMREAQNGWLDMDWYRNILKNSDMNVEDDELAFAIVENEVMEDELAQEGYVVPRGEERKRRTQNSEDTVLRGGFGSMFNDSTDWLSDARKADYVRWKSRILLEVKRVQREQSRGRSKQRSR